jgi:hypothetical protein
MLKFEIRILEVAWGFFIKVFTTPKYLNDFNTAYKRIILSHDKN